MSAPSARPRTPADDGWAILAPPPGERDLSRDAYWLASGRRSQRRRNAPRRSALVRHGGGRASIALAAVALAGTVASGPIGDAQAATSSSAGLRPGDSGPRVKALQRALRVTADGAFGPATKRAVKAFQRAHGLEAKGVVGPLTAKALGLTGAKARSAPAATPAPAGTGTGAAAAVAAASAKIGSSYAAGATGPNAFDCSGLVQYAFKQAGISLPRSSFAQYGAGTRVAAGDIQAGDLVFFNTNGPGASHDAVAISPTTALSATSHGVMGHPINSGYWGSHFLGARRVGQMS
ncbi:MAG: NlpC/P60 family protein [Solirubrobacteraceae bacterium]